jgi:AcrR family transcriptional regulator
MENKTQKGPGGSAPNAEKEGAQSYIVNTTEADKKKRARGPGRPRSARTREAILAAALDLLERRGYRAVTVEGIAAEAGAGKQTIYRWWPSKAALVLEAFARRAETEVPVPDTGNLQRDLECFLEKAFEVLSGGTARIVRGLMSEALLDESFAVELRNRFINERRRALMRILERARERGEIRPEVDLESAVDLVYGPMWYRLLNRHAPLDARFARDLAGLVTRALR